MIPTGGNPTCTNRGRIYRSTSPRNELARPGDERYLSQTTCKRVSLGPKANTVDPDPFGFITDLRQDRLQKEDRRSPEEKEWQERILSGMRAVASVGLLALAVTVLWILHVSSLSGH